MTSAQRVEVLRLRLSGIEQELRDLLVTKVTAPAASVQSAKYDAYVLKLNALERRLGDLATQLGQLARQGPGYGPPDGSRAARDRAASFDHQVASTSALLGRCWDLLADLCDPSGSQWVKAASDLGRKLDEFLKMAHGSPELRTITLRRPDTVLVPAGSAPPSLDVSIGAFVNLAIILVAALKKRPAR